MQLRWLFERIWNDSKVRNPTRFTRWHVDEFGFKEFDGVWYSPGRKVRIYDPSKQRQAARIRRAQLRG